MGRDGKEGGYQRTTSVRERCPRRLKAAPDGQFKVRPWKITCELRRAAQASAAMCPPPSPGPLPFAVYPHRYRGLECHNGLDAIGLFRALRTSGDYLWGFKLPCASINLGLCVLDLVDAMARVNLRRGSWSCAPRRRHRAHVTALLDTVGRKRPCGRPTHSCAEVLRF